MKKQSRWRQLYEQRRSEVRELRRLAWHESAHACINYALGVEVEQIIIGRGLDDPDSLALRGKCEWRTRDGNGIDQGVMLLTSLAGPSADMVFCDRTPSREGGDYADARRAAEAIANATGDSVDAILERGEREAMALVIRHEAAIERLAEVLLSPPHQIAGPEAERLLAQNGVKRIRSTGPEGKPDFRRVDGFVA